MPTLESLVWTTEFLDSLEKLSPRDEARVFRALRVLDEDERHPSLNVHLLKGKAAGLWSAYASKSLRITFERLEGGNKRLLEASHHYGD